MGPLSAKCTSCHCMPNSKVHIMYDLKLFSQFNYFQNILVPKYTTKARLVLIKDINWRRLLTKYIWLVWVNVANVNSKWVAFVWVVCSHGVQSVWKNQPKIWGVWEVACILTLISVCTSNLTFVKQGEKVRLWHLQWNLCMKIMNIIATINQGGWHLVWGHW